MTRRSPSVLLALFVALSCGGRSDLVGVGGATSRSDGTGGDSTATGSAAAGAGGTAVDGGAECDAGEIACGGACVDPLHDSSNCGECGVACPAAVPCIAGSCPPVPTAGLVLWLAANHGVTAVGGAVEAWADQSGAGNDVASPTNPPSYVPMGLNGLPTVHFDGEGSFLTVPSKPSLDFGTSVDFTVIMVVAANPAAKPLTGIVSKAQHTEPALHGWQIHVRNESENFAEEIIASPYGGSSQQSKLNIQDGVARILTVIFRRSPGEVRTYASGALIQAMSYPQLAGDLTTTDPLRIGTERSQVNFMRGDIAELMIYATAISDESRAAVELYLSEKYGLP